MSKLSELSMGLTGTVAAQRVAVDDQSRNFKTLAKHASDVSWQCGGGKSVNTSLKDVV